MPKVLGLDCSEHQGEMDWGTAIEAGANFAFVRASILHAEDEQFQRNTELCDLPRGYYHFLSKWGDPIWQAELFCDLIEEVSWELRPAVDCESYTDPAGIFPFCEYVQERLKVTPTIYCVAPGTRILMKDMSWIPAEELITGDEIIGFDERAEAQRRGRRLKHATITATGIRPLPTYDIHLANGEILRSTGEHKWLTRLGRGRGGGIVWTRTDKLQSHIDQPNRKRPVTLQRFFKPYKPATTFAAGFLSAAFDGEGCLSTNTNNQYSLSFVQKPNAMNNQVRHLLYMEGFEFADYMHTSGCQATYLGDKHSVLRFLMKYRPPRLLEKLWDSWDITKMKLDSFHGEEVIRVDYAGIQDVVTLSSSSKTYIAEGFGAHNTGAYWWNPNVGNQPIYAAFPLWIALWTDSTADPLEIEPCPPWTSWAFHQFSSKDNGRGAGFGAQSGDIDLNYFNGDMEAFEREMAIVFAERYGLTPPIDLETRVERLEAGLADLRADIQNALGAAQDILGG